VVVIINSDSNRNSNSNGDGNSYSNNYNYSNSNRNSNRNRKATNFYILYLQRQDPGTSLFTSAASDQRCYPGTPGKNPNPTEEPEVGD